MTALYEAALTAQAFGHFNNPLRRGAAPGKGFAIIPMLVAKFPPFPFPSLPGAMSGDTK